MAKYSKKIVQDICSLIEKDSYTVSEICQMVRIDEATYYRWKNDKNDFCEAVKKAQGRFDKLIAAEAKKSLVKLVRGYTVQEKKVVHTDTGRKDEGGKPILKVKEHAVVDKHYQPNTGAVIFALTNRDPENWKNKMNTEHSGSVDVKSKLEQLSDDELEAIVNEE